MKCTTAELVELVRWWNNDLTEVPAIVEAFFTHTNHAVCPQLTLECSTKNCAFHTPDGFLIAILTWVLELEDTEAQ